MAISAVNKKLDSGERVNILQFGGIVHCFAMGFEVMTDTDESAASVISFKVYLG